MLHFELDTGLVDYKIVSFLALQRMEAIFGSSTFIAFDVNSVAQDFFDSVTPGNIILKHSLNYLFRSDGMFHFEENDTKRRSECWDDNYFDALERFFQRVKRKKGFDHKNVDYIYISPASVCLRDKSNQTMRGEVVLSPNYVGGNPISLKTFPFYPTFNPQKHHKNGLKKGRHVLVPMTIVGKDEEEDGYKAEYWNKNKGLFGEFVVAAEDAVIPQNNHHGKH